MDPGNGGPTNPAGRPRRVGLGCREVTVSIVVTTVVVFSLTEGVEVVDLPTNLRSLFWSVFRVLSVIGGTLTPYDRKRSRNWLSVMALISCSAISGSCKQGFVRGDQAERTRKLHKLTCKKSHLQDISQSTVTTATDAPDLERKRRIRQSENPQSSIKTARNTNNPDLRHKSRV